MRAESIAEKHANDEIPEFDPGHDPIAEAQLLFGYSNDSIEDANIRRAILELRAAGRVVVREADGFGIIRDDDVLRGVLSREDFALLLDEEWQLRLVAVEPADCAETALPARPTGELALAAEPVPYPKDSPASGTLPDDPMQRRRTCLDWFRAEDGKRPGESGKRGKWGALQRVVERSGIDKDTLGAMLDKAIDEKRAADAYAQLMTAKR